VITLDADLSHPPETLPELVAASERADVVIASRYVAGGSARMPIARSLLSRLLNLVYRRALAVPVADLSSGFRLYHRRVLDELALVSEKYDVLEEILVKIYSRGWRVLEIPFAYRPRAAGQSHANVIGFTPAFLATLVSLWRMRNSASAADYDARAFDSIVLPQRWWQRRRYQIVTAMLGDRHPRLDAGCGSSRIAQADPRTVAMDVEIAKLRFLRESNPLRVRASTLALPFPDGHFAAVLSSQVIEHIPLTPALFRELHRVLAPGGTLVIGTPDYGRAIWRAIETLYRWILPNAYGDEHITHYTRHSLLEQLADHGFAIRRYRYVFWGELIVQCEKLDEEDAGEPSHAPSP
jgi:SAM-dependent methyltransferase